MIGRVVLFTIAALVTCGAAGTALAEPAAAGHTVCVGASDGNPNTMDGVCVIIPTH